MVQFTNVRSDDMENSDKEKKKILLRLSSSLWQELVIWSEDEFRSLNGQIEYLLTESVKHRNRGKS